MNLIKLNITLLTIVLFVGCKQSNSKLAYNNNDVDSIKNIKKILKINNEGYFIDTQFVYYKLKDDDSNLEIIKTPKLNSEDLKTIDSLLTEAIKVYNNEQLEEWKKYKSTYPKGGLSKDNFVIDISNYDKRYQPYYFDADHKVVNVYCVCERDFGQVCDGGNCFFNIWIDLTTKTHGKVATHGIG